MNTKYSHNIARYVLNNLKYLNKILPALLLLVFTCPFFVINAHSHDRDEHPHDRDKHIVFGPKIFGCEKGEPETERFIFHTHKEGSDFTMKIENGDRSGCHGVSSAHITLNGEDVFGPSDFNQQTGTLERQVTLQEHNILKVQLEGKRESFIVIAITKTKNPPPSNVTVPNIVGMAQDAARNAITSAGLTIGTITTAYSSTVPSGSVISQNPVSGALVAKGSAINLTVSQGLAPVSVPNVTGMTQTDAGSAITAANLVLGTLSSAYSATVPAGNVISQNPASGTSVQAGSSVSLVISSGPPPVSVPNVIGMTQPNAQSAITAAMLTVGTITSANSSTVPAGSVISQNPAANALVTQGSSIALVVSSGPPPAAVPPDPATVAPATDGTVATTIAASTAFLYTGNNPIQTGVAAGTIEIKRAAVLRGQVNDRDGHPISGVVITILNHPEFGQTVTRTDGMFDMAVNGGGLLTVSYEKTSYLPVQRQINAPWQDYAWLPVVVLIPVDTQVTTINLGSASQIQVHRGNIVTDADGSRQATLLFSAATTAQMVMPDGSTQPLGSLNVRASEYTVGPNGPKTMPGELPPASGYTYAVELSADEAIAAGAKQVTFSQPVYFYVDNFLNFPIGGAVPVGYYDRVKSAWIPSNNGRIIKILSISNGLADLDTDGSGQPADAGKLAALNVTDAERQQLGILYAAGKTLWRAPVTHFSIWDCNWPWGFPKDATTPDQPESENKPTPCPCEKGGSIIECQNQVLGERIGIPGTPFTLNYRSSRVPGYQTAYTVNIPVSGASVPASLKRIDLIIQVAGRRFSQSFSAATNQSYTFTWDGKDAYGRIMQGKQPLTVRIGYVYELVYLEASNGSISFGNFSDSAISLSSSFNDNRAIGGEATLWQAELRSIGGFVFDARTQGLGGWDLDIHHAYDPVGKVLLLGDGSWRSADLLGAMMITTVAGNGTWGYSGDGGPATSASLYSPHGVAAGSDGSIYIADGNNNRIRRVEPNGIITTVAGNGTSGYSGDGGPATSASLYLPHGVAAGSDGSIYIADGNNNRIRRVGPNGIITTVAGNGTAGYSGDGGPATNASLGFPIGVAVGPDGSIYIADGRNNRIRRVGPDGIITTVAGNGTADDRGDGGPATNASLGFPIGVAVGPDGSIYIADAGNYRIRRVGPDGIITTVAGNGTYGGYIGDGDPATSVSLSSPIGVAVGPDGSIYIADDVSGRIRRVGPDGIITTVAGGGTSGNRGDGSATNGLLGTPNGVAVGPDGSIYIAEPGISRIRRVASYWPDKPTSDISIPSEDGGQLYVFNCSGKHQRTLNSLTGATVFSFSYDSGGRLATITDGSGNTTTIARDAGGNPAAIVAPFGQRTALTLDANGYLASLTNPAGESTLMTYSGGGLMATYADPKGNIHNFTYDTIGLLVRDDNPAGGFTTLDGTSTLSTQQEILTTALGRTSTFLTEYLSTGDQRQTITTPAGTQSVTLSKTDGSEQATMPDGTTSSVTLGIDPRFGTLVYIPASSTVKTPSGLIQSTSLTRTATFADPTNPLSLATQTDKLSINGRIYTSLFDATQNQSTLTTPAGRKLVALTDSLGRPLSFTLDQALTPITFNYDSKGRLIQAAQGNQLATYVYDSSGRVTSSTDALSNKSQYAYDLADRLTLLTLPSGRAYSFSYDANGNRTKITMPNGSAHTLGYTVINLGSDYTPPDNLPYSWQYSVDQEWLRTLLPGGRTVEAAYDSGGRALGIVYPEATVSLNYGDTTDRVTHSIRTPAGGGASQVTSFTYDGSLVTGMVHSGAAIGQFAYTYDNNFHINKINFTSGSDTVTTAITRDNDGLIKTYGPFTFTRGGPVGAISRINDTASLQTASTTLQNDDSVSLLTYAGNLDTLRGFKGEKSGQRKTPLYSLLARKHIARALLEHVDTGNRTELRKSSTEKSGIPLLAMNDFISFDRIAITIVPTTTVPNVVGMTETNAEAAILAAGVTVESVTSVSSDTVASGVVISQNPVGGTIASSVDITVSSGPMITIPNVVGMTKANAQAAILASNLTVGTFTIATSNNVQPGAVISQSPAAGTSVAANTAVSMVITPTTTVPNIVGMTETDAEAAILASGVTVGSVTKVSSDTVASGVVISQNPVGGIAASSVDITVSSGPMITIPNVVGMTKANAQAAILASNLTVGTISAAISSTIQPGAVISQTPAAGTSVVSNTAVSMVVCSANAGLDINITYDSLGRVSSRTHTVNWKSIYSIQLSYDSRGNISQKTETVAGTTDTWGYSYDSDGQLTNVTKNGVDEEVYTYGDLNGNRTGYQRTTSNILSGYDTQDRLVQVGATLYKFNADGQMIQRGDDTFTYSSVGELQKATVSGKTISYAYDGMHRRVAHTDSSGTYQYLYGNLKKPFQLTAMRDPAGVLTYYYYDDAGLLFAFDKGGVRYYVASDQVGTPKTITDSTGAVVKYLEYDSFGMPTLASNPDFFMPVGFASGVTDTTTGLVRFGYRDYEPNNGRWTAKDPIFFEGGQGNLYQYVQNNPVNWIDPEGLAAIPGSVPPNIPGGPYVPAGPGQKPGTFFGPKQTSGPRSIVRWVPDGNNGGPSGSEGYWKAQTPSQKGWQRFNPCGNPITPNEAHPSVSPPPKPKPEPPPMPWWEELLRYPVIWINGMECALPGYHPNCPGSTI